MSENPHFHRVGFCTERRDDGAPCTLSWGHSGRHSYCGDDFDVPIRFRDWVVVGCALAAVMILLTVFSGVTDTLIDVAIKRWWR